MSCFAWDPVELVAAFLSMLGVWLAARERVASWPVGIVGVLLYAWIFFEARLYGETGLQLAFAAISVYGWWHWVRGTGRSEHLPVTRMPARWWPPLVLATAAGALLIGWLLATRTDAAIPWLDAALTATSLAAQWQLSRKYVENWLLWILVDVVYVPTFWSRCLHVTALLYVVFTVLAVLGWRSWRRAMAAPVAADT